MAAQWKANPNGAGIETSGLVWNPYAIPGGYNSDGLGLLTAGFVWSAAGIWAKCAAGVSTSWTGCSCSVNCS